MKQPSKAKSSAVASALGVSIRSVQLWRKRKSLPKNPLIRAAYLKAEGKKS